MRMVANWDTKVIEMLHKCDAGEMSVLSVYPPGFQNEDPMNGYSEVSVDAAIFAMRWY